ncbi:hypothetical protein [Nitrococcus mobilis]|uniref:Uncharacterized protein n=1 Tax=Nitrococcus mobilis Nb-231 TaxID=314278 RepID=A4BRJ6_9GAMM|nr:hypothetical protein [Nitrococcus mobilis]EAR21567.1 hypothetical protein NB231_02333 [Nitrococcus mobilis Nb-231]
MEGEPFVRKLSVLLILSIVSATLISLAAHPEPYEHRLQRVALQEALPQMAGVLAHEPAAVKAVFLHYAGNEALVLNARLALLRYPVKTRRILSLYGTDPAFQEALGAYGASVIPPIDYFLGHDIGTLKVLKFAGEAVTAASRFWKGGAPVPTERTAANNDGVLAAPGRGRYAIAFIQKEGHDFLGQFVVDAAGQVHWIQSERVLQGISSFFAGGIRSLETKYRTDEEVGTADYLWAGVDVLATAAAVKALRVSRTGAATAGAGAETVAAGGRGARAAESASLMRRTAALAPGLIRAGGLGGRIAKYGAIAATAYIVLRHPSLITGLAGEVARLAGVPTWPVQLTVWSVLLLPVLYLGVFLLRLVLRPLLFLASAVAAGLAWLERRDRRASGGYGSNWRSACSSQP